MKPAKAGPHGVVAPAGWPEISATWWLNNVVWGPNFLEGTRALLLYLYVCARVPCQFPNKFFVFSFNTDLHCFFYVVVQQLAS